MTAGRLVGDWVTTWIGDRRTVTFGGLLTVGGFVVLLTAPVTSLALAVAAITTTDYAGVLLDPALIGFAASLLGLPASFWILAGLVCLVPLTARAAAGEGT